jgi:FixJ family two-component response regulator
LRAAFLNKQAAAQLGISEVTLQIHRRRIMQKMAAESFADSCSNGPAVEHRARAPEAALTWADARFVVAVVDDDHPTLESLADLLEAAVRRDAIK